ncbi:MAG: hypothetical protein QOH32_939 [Bradyrhizobium sp.]|jgi:hypothetical protein|nr:hypothetical protein [Bradyrhizobium sp.]
MMQRQGAHSARKAHARRSLRLFGEERARNNRVGYAGWLNRAAARFIASLRAALLAAIRSFR